jgi:cytochrome c553
VNFFEPIGCAARIQGLADRAVAFGNQSGFIAPSRQKSREESRMRVGMRRLFWASLCLLAVGCGGGGASEPEGEASSGGEGGSEYEGPVASTDVAHGQEVFASFCDDCHPDGGEDVGPSLIADPHTAAYIRKQIREGSGKMRPFSEKRLSNDDMEALLAWLASVNAVK